MSKEYYDEKRKTTDTLLPELYTEIDCDMMGALSRAHGHWGISISPAW
jgi:hypothetical protein